MHSETCEEKHAPSVNTRLTATNHLTGRSCLQSEMETSTSVFFSPNMNSIKAQCLHFFRFPVFECKYKHDQTPLEECQQH